MEINLNFSPDYKYIRNLYASLLDLIWIYMHINIYNIFDRIVLLLGNLIQKK